MANPNPQLSSGMICLHCTISPIAFKRLQEVSDILGATYSDVARQAVTIWLSERRYKPDLVSRPPGRYSLHLYLWPSLGILLLDAASQDEATLSHVVEGAILEWCKGHGDRLVRFLRDKQPPQSPESVRQLERQQIERAEKLSILRTQYSYYRSTGNTMRAGAIARQIEEIKQETGDGFLVG